MNQKFYYTLFTLLVSFLYNAAACDNSCSTSAPCNYSVIDVKVPDFCVLLNVSSTSIITIDVGVQYLTYHESNSTVTFKHTAYDPDILGIDFFVFRVLLDLRSVLTINVTIIDTNNHPPSFDVSQPYRITIVECYDDIYTQYNISLPTATDYDRSLNSFISYTLIDQTQTFQLHLESDMNNVVTTITIMNLVVLDRENMSKVELVLEASDNGDIRKTTALNIVIYLEDLNDNFPVFANNRYEYIVHDNASIPYNVTTINATDADVGSNGDIRYQIDMVTGSYISEENYRAVINIFTLSRSGGLLSILNPIDLETSIKFKLVIRATDNGFSSLATGLVVYVTVSIYKIIYPQITIDSNRDGIISIIENHPLYQPIAFITPLTAQVEISTISIDPINSVLSLNSPGDSIWYLHLNAHLDYETTKIYNYTIHTEDYSDPRLTYSTNFLLVVSDFNDNAPEFNEISFNISISEAFSGILDSTNVIAHDNDCDTGESYCLENKDIVYSLEYIESITIRNLTMFPNGSLSIKYLNYEQNTTLTFIINAHDLGSPRESASSKLIIQIEPVNEYSPQFIKSNYVFSLNVALGAPIGSVSATDDDAGIDGVIIYSLVCVNNLPSIILINCSNGDLYVCSYNCTIDHLRNTTYHCNVTARDRGVPSKNTTVQVNISFIQFFISYNVSNVTQLPNATSISVHGIAISIPITTVFIIIFAIVVIIVCLLFLKRKKCSLFSNKFKVTKSEGINSPTVDSLRLTGVHHIPNLNSAHLPVSNDSTDILIPSNLININYAPMTDEEIKQIILSNQDIFSRLESIPSIHDFNDDAPYGPKPPENEIIEVSEVPSDSESSSHMSISASTANQIRNRLLVGSSQAPRQSNDESDSIISFNSSLWSSQLTSISRQHSNNNSNYYDRNRHYLSHTRL